MYGFQDAVVHVLVSGHRCSCMGFRHVYIFHVEHPSGVVVSAEEKMTLAVQSFVFVIINILLDICFTALFHE